MLGAGVRSQGNHDKYYSSSCMSPNTPGKEGISLIVSPKKEFKFINSD